MKVIYFLILIFIVATSAKGQPLHYIYIQTEDKQPFYVRANEKIYSSSESGSLTIPKLIEGDFIFTIGFPKNSWPAQKYKITIGQKDLGLILKKSTDNLWSLFNLQSLQLIPSLDATGNPITNNTKNDFSSLLAQVSNMPLDLQVKNQADTSRKRTELIHVDSNDSIAAFLINNKTSSSLVLDSINKKDTINTVFNSNVEVVKKKDTIKFTTENMQANAISPPVIPINPPVIITDSSITPIQNPINSTRADTAILSAKKQSITDTIKNEGYLTDSLKRSLSFIEDIVIQQPKLNADSFVSSSKPTLRNDSSSRKDSILISTITTISYDTIVENKHPSAEDTTTLDSEIVSAVSIAQIDSMVIKDTVAISSDVNRKHSMGELKSTVNARDTQKGDSSVNLQDLAKNKQNCPFLASDSDFIQLRRDMTNEDGESRMVSSALAFFRKKCFTTAQIKNLAVLFLQDDSRLLFLEMAYSHTSDVEHFASLESLLIENKNINSFKSLFH